MNLTCNVGSWGQGAPEQWPGQIPALGRARWRVKQGQEAGGGREAHKERCPSGADGLAVRAIKETELRELGESIWG